MKYLLLCTLLFSMGYGAATVTHQSVISQRIPELHPTDERKQPRPIEPLALIAFGTTILTPVLFFGGVGVGIVAVMALGSLTLSIISLVRIKRGKEKKRGKGLALLSLFFSLILTGFALMMVFI
ncbi:hypothetical protein P1X15_14090 [Runella sp. MFBS21]|uniref:hypothetical protein n=1 Tax=Runella sp. MFBS21 TaxID=3034018 RepID=UPI0023F73DAE|nr:hypothetical protein [Runella sp. MFBS21]MDF7818741.1 hypothetical protein [Runella sp. MFBS21]